MQAIDALRKESKSVVALLQAFFKYFGRYWSSRSSAVPLQSLCPFSSLASLVGGYKFATPIWFRRSSGNDGKARLYMKSVGWLVVNFGPQLRLRNGNAPRNDPSSGLIYERISALYLIPCLQFIHQLEGLEYVA
ncbi:hypothetical protein GALMADRAFT_231747 [Galerina marginata CBS 339.88]|uniref:Uncharacterized protein n=1 Tax=Galerina marginata (strain CBS 339.88) TaxID=685588 RepID=A0A067SAG9_GALM3|nr:hypothetical protein GALMADRAFT_231747 [Galerina marginata CBS 339.88]